MSDSTAAAPIALFAYRRPDHLARTLAAIAANPEAAASELYVFADAARDDAALDGVSAVRSMLGSIEGFAAVHAIMRERNYGLARNITTGVSQVLGHHGRVIVVEDDVVVSPFFLAFMNEALQLYENESRVGSLTGYCYPVGSELPETYFIRGADCWGWATWRDRWALFEPDGQLLLAEIDQRGLAHAFDFDGAAQYRAMLIDQIEGRNDSWAVRWHASCFLKDRLILYPGRSLVHNIGADGSGTHFVQTTDSFASTLSALPIKVGGISIEESQPARDAIRAFHSSVHAAPQPAQDEAAETTSSLQPPARGMLMRRIAKQLVPPVVVTAWRSLNGRRSGHLVPREMQHPVLHPTLSGPPQPPMPRYRGLQELDRQIGKYLDIDNGFFVELGANDGLFQSNTWHYETYRGWRGVLVEPAPNLFLECRRNRAPQTHVACAACVPFGYPDAFVKMIYSNAMSVSLGLDSDLTDPLAHAELGRQFLKPEETVFAFGAVARPLDHILAEANAPALIDFLSLDVEGAEIDVLRGVDHARRRFRHILLECRDITRLRDYLEPLGYRLVERFNEHDYLFVPTELELK